MIDIQQFREQGYLYDSLENYKEFIDFDAVLDIKEFIDSKNIIRHSRYDYWFKYNDLSYMEEIRYDNLLKNDKNLQNADIIFEKNHEYQLKKIKECGFYPTWVFGTAMDDEIGNKIRNRILENFQIKFSKHYYSDKENDKYANDFRLQFYTKGCEIKLHDDGSPENRYCVFIYFLNNNWDESNGGNLILYKKDGEKIKVKPTFPNFVVLDSDVNLFHEVEEVLNDMKYNIVCFFGKQS
jgi:Rps23 Pro-64 3,4-dihydroxylase Tpa1-like proline 4-hydroxylase